MGTTVGNCFCFQMFTFFLLKSPQILHWLVHLHVFICVKGESFHQFYVRAYLVWEWLCRKQLHCVQQLLGNFQPPSRDQQEQTHCMMHMNKTSADTVTDKQGRKWKQIRLKMVTIWHQIFLVLICLSYFSYTT